MTFANSRKRENELAAIVVDLCLQIHMDLGPGLLESVYEEIVCFELIERGLRFERQKGVSVTWKGQNMGLGFRSDIIIEQKLILEIKSIESIAPVHFKQVLTYLKLTNLKLALLINFNEPYIKNGTHRVVNKL